MNLPIYKIEINDVNEGITAISLVDEPAVESNFLKFSKDKIKLNFKVENEEKRIVTGVVIRCDFPIYRVTNEGNGYFIIFNEETILKITEKMLKDNTFNNINLGHNANNFVDGINLRELFIKNKLRGINPIGFEDVEDGSLMASYHVTNDDVWKEIKDGIFNGFSLEGWFSIEKFAETPKGLDDIKDYNDFEQILKNILNK